MKIIMMPGLDGTGLLLTDIRDRLAAQREVDVLRYPPELSRYDDLAGWVRGRLPEEDFILVAESFSGPLAMLLAAEKPPGLKGVVCVATFTKAPRRLPSVLAHVLRVLPTGSPLAARLAQPVLMGRWSNADFTARFREALGAVPAGTLAARLGEVLCLNLSGIGRDIGVPVVYLQASDDRLVPNRAAAEFDAPLEEIISIEGPHFLLQANPAASAARIHDFAALFG